MVPIQGCGRTLWAPTFPLNFHQRELPLPPLHTGSPPHLPFFSPTYPTICLESVCAIKNGYMEVCVIDYDENGNDKHFDGANDDDNYCR